MSIYHVPDNDDAPDRSYGKPRPALRAVGNCEICGSDRFVRVLRNGGRICISCLDALQKTQPQDETVSFMDRANMLRKEAPETFRGIELRRLL